MIKAKKQVIRILKHVLCFLKNGWKISNNKNLFAFRGNKHINIEIRDIKYWLQPTMQHIQFYIGRLFISFAQIASYKQTYKNILRAFVFTMKFIQNATAHQMAKIAFDSLVIGCSYDKVIFKGPFIKNNNISFFKIDRIHGNHDVHLYTRFSKAPLQCEIDIQKEKILLDKTCVDNVDECIDLISGYVFLLPEYR